VRNLEDQVTKLELTLAGLGRLHVEDLVALKASFIVNFDSFVDVLCRAYADFLGDLNRFR